METLNSLTVNVDLQNPYDFEELPLIADIQKWCEASIQENTSTKVFDNRLSLLIRVVDSAESADLNENYRSKEGPTNVLSFPNEVPDFMLDIPDLKEQSSALGDLVICEPIVRKESLEQEKSLMAHWAHLVIHGVLHLQGFDHIEDNEAVEMETLEVKILEQFGYTDPYANIS